MTKKAYIYVERSLILGEKFGFLEVLNLTPKRTGCGERVRYCIRCRCSHCKKIVYVRKNFLLRGSAKTCGATSCKQAWYAAIHDPIALETHLIVGCFERNATRRNISWNLSIDKARELIHLPCFYCGTTYSSVRKFGKRTIKYNGIDRLNNNIGYEELNVVSCCKTCNFMKHIQNFDDFLHHIKSIHDNLSLQNLGVKKEAV